MKKVNQIDLNNINSIDELVKQYYEAGVFGAGKVGKAVEILYEAKQNNSTFLVGLAGAMVPGGLRKVISQAIRDGYIHSLTTTGANITHDLIEAFGGMHIKDVEYKSDLELYEKGIDRVYDAFVAAGSFGTFEDNIRILLQQLMKERTEPVILSPSELIHYFGSKISDPDSIVKAAYDMNIPIFVPAISDSVLGMQIWMFAQFNKLIIDATLDVGKIQDVYHEREKTCALTLGGGVPKNFTLQAALIASHHYNYAVQITMDRVETGGLSGATLQEAISWGKIEPDGKFVTVTGDVTIILPLILSALRERYKNSAK